MSGTLPGLGGREWRVAGGRYQRIAHATAVTTHAMLHTILQTENERDGTRDGGPIISGAIGGLLNFWTESDVTDDEIIAEVARLVLELLPQVRMAKATDGMAGGNA